MSNNAQFSTQLFCPSKLTRIIKQVDSKFIANLTYKITYYKMMDELCSSESLKVLRLVSNTNSFKICIFKSAIAISKLTANL